MEMETPDKHIQKVKVFYKNKVSKTKRNKKGAKQKKTGGL
jgi:hypothetical protein